MKKQVGELYKITHHKWTDKKICPYCKEAFIPTPKSPNACLVRYCRLRR